MKALCEDFICFYPTLAEGTFAEGTFNAAFVPSYTSELTKGKSKSNNFANEVFTLLFLILLLSTLFVLTAA